MDILNKESAKFNNYVSTIVNNDMMGSALTILLILFAVLVAPKLPLSITQYVNNIYFKLIFITIIILLANKNVVLSLLCLIIFFIIINKKATQTLVNNLSSVTPSPVAPLVPPSPVAPLVTPSPVTPLVTLSPVTPLVTLSPMSDEIRLNTITASAIPIPTNITPSALSTIVSISPVVDNMISQIKENFTDYIDTNIQNEKILRDKINLEDDQYISQQLDNSANRLAIARNAIYSIINNNNVDTNNQILKCLVKSDLLSNASNKANEMGDDITASQLQQVSDSQSNVINAILQTDILNSTALTAKQNGLIKESTKLSNTANTHLLATINMINYNNNIESALDAFLHGDSDLAKKYEDQANSYLKNNQTLNDSVKGIPVEYSEILYAEVPSSSNNKSLPANIPPNSSCDNIKAVNITGWDDYASV